MGGVGWGGGGWVMGAYDSIADVDTACSKCGCGTTDRRCSDLGDGGGMVLGCAVRWCTPLMTAASPVTCNRRLPAGSEGAFEACVRACVPSKAVWEGTGQRVARRRGGMAARHQPQVESLGLLCVLYLHAEPRVRQRNGHFGLLSVAEAVLTRRSNEIQNAITSHEMPKVAKSAQGCII